MRRYLILINIVFTALIGWTAYEAYITWSAERKGGAVTADAGVAQAARENPVERSTGFPYYQAIIAQDLFGTTVQKQQVRKVEKPRVEEIPVSRRSLHLKGTVVGRENNSYAVIVDGRNPEGEVFRVNDMLHNARILEILPDRVILESEGKQEALVLTYELDMVGKEVHEVERPERVSGKADRSHPPGTKRLPGAGGNPRIGNLPERKLN